jgi:uncharacterized RDD family membrane protein YckC
MKTSRDDQAPTGRSGVGQAIGDAAVYPARVAAHALRGTLETAAEDVLAAPEIARLLDRALSGSLPEEFVQSLVRHHVLERAIRELARTGELDRLLERALASPRSLELVDRALASDEMRRALERTLSGPELRNALASQSAGLVGQVADALRRAAHGLDRRLGRPAAAPADVFAGVASRGVALVVDAALVAAVTLVLGAGAGLVAWFAGGLQPRWLAGTLAGLLNVVVAAGYFTLFWSTVGQTPGMRLMHVRVLSDRPDRGLTVGRALVRTFGLVLAIIPCFLGFAPALFDRRRRALPDYLAQTVVAYDDGPSAR